MRTIKIIAGSATLNFELLETPTAGAILQQLLLSSSTKTWVRSVFFHSNTCTQGNKCQRDRRGGRIGILGRGRFNCHRIW